MNTKQGKILLWVIVFLILGGTVFALMKLPKKDGSSTQATGEIAPVTTEDWITGNKESKVTLIEYGDFQCPACGAYHPLLKELLQKNSQDFRLVFRNFPLSQHANAKPAAYVAEAAGKQGKFWEMHNLLFEGQNNWSSKFDPKDIFLGYARSLNLDTNQFQKDLDSSEIQGLVDTDYQSGLKAGVNSTPTFYLNGKRIQPQSYAEFANLVKQAQ